MSSYKDTKYSERVVLERSDPPYTQMLIVFLLGKQRTYRKTHSTSRSNEIKNND